MSDADIAVPPAAAAVSETSATDDVSSAVSTVTVNGIPDDATAAGVADNVGDVDVSAVRIQVFDDSSLKHSVADIDSIGNERRFDDLPAAVKLGKLEVE